MSLEHIDGNVQESAAQPKIHGLATLDLVSGVVSGMNWKRHFYRQLTARNGLRWDPDHECGWGEGQCRISDTMGFLGDRRCSQAEREAIQQPCSRKQKRPKFHTERSRFPRSGSGEEIRNLMLDEVHFPYVVFLQGSNFATTTHIVKTPLGQEVKIRHDAGNLNRIDRVTASSFGMKINENYCRNIFVERDGKSQMLQAASFYFQCEPWTPKDMARALWDVAVSSLDVLSDSLPNKGE